MKLWAMPFGEDKFDGDSLFYCPGSEVPYKPGMGVEDIRESTIQQMIRDGWDDEEQCRRDASELMGAWILTDKSLRAIQGLVSDINPGDDGSTYRCNTACKRMAARTCIKTLIDRNYDKRRKAERLARQLYLNQNFRVYRYKLYRNAHKAWQRYGMMYGYDNMKWENTDKGSMIYVRKTALTWTLWDGGLRLMPVPTKLRHAGAR